MTVRQYVVSECLRALYVHDFLMVIPINGLGQHISSVKYRAILK